MNAIPAILQAQGGSDAAQLNAPATAASPPSRGANQDFAGALRDAGGKAARKSALAKQPEATVSGGALPVPGNQPPPVPASSPQPVSPPALTHSLAPPAVKTEVLAAAQAADSGASTAPPAGAAAADPSAIPAAPTLPANASSAAALASNLGLAGAPVSVPAGGAPVLGNGNAPGSAGNSPAVAINSPVVPGSGVMALQASQAPQAPQALQASHAQVLQTLLAPSIRALASAATSNRVPAVPQDSARDAKPGLPSQGPITPASSQTSSNALNDWAPNGTAATAAPVQAVIAAAPAQGVMAEAIVQGNAPSPDPTSPAADSTLPGAGPQGVAAAKDAPAGVPAAALAQASAAMSAAVTAATAGRIAQEVSSAAGTGAADKRLHAASSDVSLSVASNDGSAGAAQLLTSNMSGDSTPSPTFKVAAGVDTAGFGQGVADKVSVMMDGNLTSAKLQVNPPALGPIEVRIALQGGHAQVWLSSHSAVTRDALESSSPKLREMLGSQGFSQVSVDISHRSFQDRSPPSQAYEAGPAIEGVAPVQAQASASISRSAIGLLDAYA